MSTADPQECTCVGTELGSRGNHSIVYMNELWGGNTCLNNISVALFPLTHFGSEKTFRLHYAAACPFHPLQKNDDATTGDFDEAEHRWSSLFSIGKSLFNSTRSSLCHTSIKIALPVASSTTVRNLRVIFDRDMSLKIKQTLRTAFFHHIAKVRHVLSQKDAEN